MTDYFQRASMIRGNTSDINKKKQLIALCKSHGH